MRVVILGGTGPSGILLIQEALAANHTVIVYARNPAKLPSHLQARAQQQQQQQQQPAGLTIVKGELEDAQQLDSAFTSGGVVDAVLSALGPTFGNPSGTPIARGYAAVLAAMRRVGVRRLIVLGTTSIKDAKDGRSVIYAAMVAAVSVGARSAYRDIVAVGEVVRACDDIDWTIVRVPVLKNEENRVVKAGYVGDEGAGAAYTLSRLGFAVFVVQELEKGEWIKKAPLITSA
jgi:putative NADH-flavin reductase